MSFNNDERRHGNGGRHHDQRQQDHHHNQGRRQHAHPPPPPAYGREPDRPYYRSPRGYRAHRSGALQWLVAVVFTVLAVAVLLGAVAVLIVVLLVQPRSPYLAVRSAHLDALVYGQQGGLDDVQVSAVVEARNGNAHATAGFSNLEVRLAFAGAVLAILRADPFAVPAGGALPLAYVARARGVPLDGNGSAAMEAAIRGGVVPFTAEGEARTRWKIAGVVEVHHWTRLACQIRFAWPNGTALDFNCKSKSKSWFF